MTKNGTSIKLCSVRRNRVVVLGGLLGIPTVLIIGLWAYLLWANTVHPIRSRLPALPSPNGYVRAAKLFLRLHASPGPENGLPYWPAGAPNRRRRALRPASSALEAMRATFHHEWRRPPKLGFPEELPPHVDPAPWALFFVAESNLSLSASDHRTAVQRRLDAMELAARSSRGGTVIVGLRGAAAHALAFSGLERMVPTLPQEAIPDAITRVRRIRQLWPRLTDFLETDRVETVAELAEHFDRSREFRTPVHAARFLWSQYEVGGGGEEDSISRMLHYWLTPKQSVLQSVDRYHRQYIAESEKPFRHWQTIPRLDDLMIRSVFGDPYELLPLRFVARSFWMIDTELALLETALAVRLHHPEHDGYPVNLAEVSRHWLPHVPLDAWGQPVAYRLRNGRPVVYSVGPDGQEDGARAVSPRHLSQWKSGDLVFGTLRPPTRGTAPPSPM